MNAFDSPVISLNLILRSISMTNGLHSPHDKILYINMILSCDMLYIAYSV